MPKRAPIPCTNLSCRNMQPCPIHDAKKLRDRERIIPSYYRLYHSKAWKTLRAKHLRKEPYCRDCMDNGSRTPATDVDHIIPHKGDPRLFFDDSNLQSLCKPCHSRKTISEVIHDNK